MRRGVGVGILAGVLTVAAAFGTGASPDERAVAQQAPAPDRPNVLVVMADDLDTRSLRAMPKVRRLLARRGTTFRNAFATTPLCCPSRVTLLTGQYAHNHGVEGNLGAYRKFDEAGTLPISMRRAGYRTGWVGKYLLGYDGVRRVPRGWSEWHAPVHGAHRMYRYTLNENGRFRRYGTRPRHYQTDVYARKAAGFIRSSAPRRRPFFLAVAPLAPHGEPGREALPNPRPAPRHSGRFRNAPFRPPPSFNEADTSDKPSFVSREPRLDRRARRSIRRRQRDRLASLLAVDDTVGRLVRQLARTGELRDTLIVFTSDNGYLQGEHRLTGKRVLYEESARVPLVVRGPGFPRGAVRRQIVGNIDVAPTVVETAGATPGRPMDGRPLGPLARDVQVAADRDILLENPESEAVRAPGFMYAEHGVAGTELYDLTADPFQLESRHADPALADVRAQLAARLRELASCAGRGCR